MKCSLCGTDLVPGNNTCPSCGALNMSFNQQAPQNTPVTQESVIEMPQMAAQDEELETLTPPPEAQPLESTPEVVQVDSTNDADGDGIIEEFEDLDAGEAEVVNASEDMAAPSLDVEKEDLTAGATDMSASANVSTYDPTQEQPKEETQEEAMPKEAGVNFALPEIKEAEADTQGMEINTIETKTETVGVESKPKKFNINLKILKNTSYPRKLVIILLAIFLIIGILVGSTVFGKKVYTPGGTSTKKNTDKIQHVADGKNNTTYVNKYKYKIPDVYDFDKIDGGVVVYGGTDQFRIFIKGISGNYDNIANAKESVRRSLENDKVTVNNILETSIGENRYVVVEGTVGPRNRLYGFRQGPNDNLFYVEIIAEDNSFYYAGLDIANDIVNNVEYTDKYTKMEAAQYEDVSTIVVTTADAYKNA